jgi:glycosyltransferase involved in cell wall biosynthesis
VVANLLPGKGVEPFLSALARSASSKDAFELVIVGSPDADPEYARACVSAAGGDSRIRFSGALEPLALLQELARRDLMISASRMESFGMALAEARTLGVPIAARGGGNVAALVEVAAGGELCRDEGELALAFLSLCRDPDELARRHELARSHARPPRSWSDAARELLTHAPRLDRETSAK